MWAETKSSQEKGEKLLGHVDSQRLVLRVEPDEEASLYIGEIPYAQSNVHRNEVCLRHSYPFDFCSRLRHACQYDFVKSFHRTKAVQQLKGKVKG